MAEFECKDIGMKCGFKVRDENQDELMKVIKLHAENTHGIKEVDPDLAGKIQHAIKK